MQCTHNKQKSLAAEEMALFNTCISERGRERQREREIKICERGPKITIWEEREER